MVEAKRDKRGLWLPGQSPNPGGRSAPRREVGRLIREALEMPDGRNQAIESILGIAHGAERDNDRLGAWRLLMEYAYGKPKQAVELDVKQEVAEIPHDEMVVEALGVLRREMGEARLIKFLSAPPTGAVIDAELDGAKDGVERSRRGAKGARQGGRRSGKKRGSDK